MTRLLVKLFKHATGGSFYGFVILVGACVGILSASAGHSFMIGVFTDSFIVDLHLSRGMVSSIWTATLLASSLYVNLVGRLADRFGAATVVRAAVLPYAASLLLLSSAKGPASLSAGYVLVRMLGPETIDFCSRLCVNMWWVRRRGFAASVVTAVGTLMVLLPTLTSTLVISIGWRSTLVAMGLTMGCGALVSAALLVNSPELYGLAPDDDSDRALQGQEIEPLEGDAVSNVEAIKGEPEMSLLHAIRSPPFWLLQSYVLICGVPWQGVNFHMASVLAETPIGHGASSLASREAAGLEALALVYPSLALGSFATAVLYGACIDRLPRDRKASAKLLAPTLSLFMLTADCLLLAVFTLHAY